MSDVKKVSDQDASIDICKKQKDKCEDPDPKEQTPKKGESGSRVGSSEPVTNENEKVVFDDDVEEEGWSEQITIEDAYAESLRKKVKSAKKKAAMRRRLGMA